MLTLQNIHTSYGAIEALNGVDIHVDAGEIVTLIGANGAGKTTLMMTICGKPRAHKGKIIFEGQDITNLPTHEIVARGIALSPEGRRIFSRLTVHENLKLGALVADEKYFDQDFDRVCGLFPILKERLHQRGGTLSGGEQQMLAIARALMSRPKLLLLDEPSLGLAPLIVKQIFATLAEVNRKDGTTIFFVEQNAHHALRLASRAYVLVGGRVVLQGTGKELLNNPEVQSAYLEGGH